MYLLTVDFCQQRIKITGKVRMDSVDCAASLSVVGNQCFDAVAVDDER